MMEPKVLSDLLESTSDIKLSEETKASCKLVSDYFCKLINKNEANIFSTMALGKNERLSRVLKFSVPGEIVCDKIEELRLCLFNNESKDKLADLYFNTLGETFKYIDNVDIYKKLNIEDVFNATIAFYETYGIRCFQIDEKLYKDVKSKIVSSYKPFFEEYTNKYKENMQEIMLMSSFGAERNYESAYRKTTYKYIELLLSYALLFAYRYDFISQSFDTFLSQLTKDIICDSEAFYQLWLSINSKFIDKEFNGEVFSDLLFNSTNLFNEFITMTKGLYEANIDNAPIAKESDMRELYKVIYELRKELDEVKKELAEVKKC